MEIFDNVLSENHREHIYVFCVTAQYEIGWDDSATFEHRQYPCLHHSLTDDEWKELDFINGIQDPQVRYRLTCLGFDNARLGVEIKTILSKIPFHALYIFLIATIKLAR